MAFPECSLRAKRTRGLESKLVSLAGFGLHIRSPWVHVPSRWRCSNERDGQAIFELQQTKAPNRHLGRSPYAGPRPLW